MLWSVIVAVASIWTALLLARDYIEMGPQFSSYRSIYALLAMFLLWPLLWALTPLLWIAVLIGFPVVGFKKGMDIRFWEEILKTVSNGKVDIPPVGALADLQAMSKQPAKSPTSADFPRRRKPI
jgi:hypothetical protein